MRENAMLTLDGSLGHDTEVLSGAYFQQHSIASPHQVWSAAMVLSPVLRGMMGLENEVENNVLSFQPNIPAEWKAFTLRNVPAGKGTAELAYSRSADTITLVATGTSNSQLRFSPSIAPRSKVLSVKVNDQNVSHKGLSGPRNQRVLVLARLNGTVSIVIRFKGDFELSIPAELPPLGATSENIKPISEKWSANQVEYVFEGIAGKRYALPVRGLEAVAEVEGASYSRDTAAGDQTGLLIVIFPPGSGYVRQSVVVKLK
jgi:hypothetical protein